MSPDGIVESSVRVEQLSNGSGQNPQPYKNLPLGMTPFNTLSKERMREIAIKGGKSTDPAVRSLAQKIRFLKTRDDIKDKDFKWLVERLQDPHINIADMQTRLTKLYEAAAVDGKTNFMLRIIELETVLHKAHHGEKIRTENLNININTSVEEWESRLSKMTQPEVDDLNSKK